MLSAWPKYLVAQEHLQASIHTITSFNKLNSKVPYSQTETVFIPPYPSFVININGF